MEGSRGAVGGEGGVAQEFMTKPVLNQLNFVCGNVDASLAFYRRLGVEVAETAIWRTASGGHHAIGPLTPKPVKLEFDSAAFAQAWNSAWKGRDDLRGRLVVGFAVATREEVDALYRDMTGAGYRGLQEPYDALWGARYAMIEDPDGVAVGLMSPASPDRRSPPPDL